MTTKSSLASSLLAKRARVPHPPINGDREGFAHEVIKRRIEKAGYEVFRITALSDGTGHQYWLFGGGVVNVYNTGTVVPGGKITDAEKARLKRKLCSCPH